MPYHWRWNLEAQEWEPCYVHPDGKHFDPWYRSLHDDHPYAVSEDLIGPEIPVPSNPRLVGDMPEPEDYDQYVLHLLEHDEEEAA